MIQENTPKLEPMDDELYQYVDYLVSQIAVVTQQIPDRYPAWKDFIGAIGGTIAGTLELAASVG